MSWNTWTPSRSRPLVVEGASFPAGMDQALVDLFRLCVLEATRRTGYKLHPGWCWGAFNRPIAGTTVLSYHGRAGGRAGDINAPVNNRGTRGNIPIEFVHVMESYGWGWGGRWSYTDPMHFEWRGSPASAHRALRRARRNAHPQPTRPKWYYRVGDRFFGRRARAVSYMRAKTKRLRAQQVEADLHVHRTHLHRPKN